MVKAETETKVSSPSIYLSTSSSSNESEYSPVGSIIKVLIPSLISLSNILKAEVDFPLFVVPTVIKCLSNNVLGCNLTE